jgi:5'-nucleotidase
MPHLVRATAVLAGLALLVPAGAVAKKKPRHTTSVRVVTALPKKPKNLKRKCGHSHSAKKVRTRRSSRPTKNRLRTVTHYCNGGTRTVLYLKRTPPKTVTKTVTVPVLPPPAKPITVPRSFRLTLLHNNDGESKYNVGDSVAGYGGITRFKTVLDGLRAQADAYTSFAESVGAEDKGTVTISSGDNYLAGLNLRASFQRYDADGTPWYDSQALDALGYDAATIGNHEYDFGPERLAQFVRGAAKTQFVTANTDFSGEPSLQALRDSGRIANSVVVTKGGQRIGIIGVSPPETPSISSPRHVTFRAAAGDVNAEAQRLTDAGVNKIILSSHLQNSANEKALVGQVHNVDIVISGGADDLQANESDTLIPGSPAPAFPYPRLIADADGHPVPMVTTQGEYRYVGRLTVTFDPAGHIASTDMSRTGPVRVTADPSQPDYVAENQQLKSEITDPLAAYKASLAAHVIGTSDVALDGGNPNPIRQQESNLGDLVADGFRAAANRTAVADGRPLADVAFSNGGGIRTSIAAGDVSEKQTFDVLPFDNVIVTVPGVTPAKLKELMEWGFAVRPDGRFPQISGFKVTVSASAPSGSRVTDIELDDGTPIVTGGSVAPGAPDVNLATTNFTASGGDGYPFGGLTQVAAGVAYQQSLYDFIVTDLGGHITAADYPNGGEGRITILP